MSFCQSPVTSDKLPVTSRFMGTSHGSMTAQRNHESWRSTQSAIRNPQSGALPSRDHFLDHLAVNVGQTEIAAVVAVGELFVIETEQVENGGVEIVNVDFVFHGAIAEFIGDAISLAAPHAAA